MYVCSCFGITEEQVREHAEAGACTPRQIASTSKAGTDCGSCVRRIQGLLGRGTCPRRALLGQKSSETAAVSEAAVPETPAAPAAAPVVPAAAPVVPAAAAAVRAA